MPALNERRFFHIVQTAVQTTVNALVPSTGSLVLLFAVVVTVTPITSQAAQSYVNCTGFIDSLPATITTQGTWCLRADLTTAITSGNAITIANNNVTIDCNDFKLGGLAAGLGTQAYGIALIDRFNATVRHCNIRGFAFGISFYSSNATSGGGHTVEDNRFDSNTYAGIFVAGNGSTVQRNRISATGGGTIYSSVFPLYAFYAVDILDNTVTGVAISPLANAFSIGIATYYNVNGSISGNHIRGLTKVGAGYTVGIYINTNGRVTLRNNDVVSDGSANNYGLYCTDAKALALNNVVSGFATPLTNCAINGNIIVP